MHIKKEKKKREEHKKREKNAPMMIPIDLAALFGLV